MKKKVLSLLVGIAAVPGVLALPTVVINNTPADPGLMLTAVTSANGTFQTFCLETSEYVSIGTRYWYDVGTAAKFNNISGNSDPICLATAWLYTSYNTVSGYSPDATHHNAIQNAIWALEDESSTASALRDAYISAAQTGAGLGWASDAGGAYGVYVMNVFTADAPNNDFAHRAQDFLLRVPGVPDGGLTVMLLGLGLGSLAFVSRKIRK